MSTQHTPGPWTINGDPDPYIGIVSRTIEPNICDMVSSLSPDEVTANARVIAAAPELLAALQGISAALTQNHTFPADVEYCRVTARAALALATQEATV